MDALRKFVASIINLLVPTGKIRFNIEEKDGGLKRKFISAVPDYDGEFGAVEAVEEIRQRADNTNQLLPLAKLLVQQYGMMTYIFRGPKVIDLARRVVISRLNSSVYIISEECHIAAAKILKYAADQKDLDDQNRRLRIDYRMRQVSLSEIDSTSRNDVDIVSFEDVRNLADTVIRQFPGMERSTEINKIVSRHVEGWRDGDVIEQLDDTVNSTTFQKTTKKEVR